jgi:hypothetical protein
MFKLGDIVEVKLDAWDKYYEHHFKPSINRPSGKIIHMTPVGDNYILLDSCGHRFLPEHLDLLSRDVDTSEFG